MPFVKGQRHPKQGGKQPGAGRKTNQRKGEDEAATVIAQRMLDQHVTGIMSEYVRLARGGSTRPFGGTAVAIIKDAVSKYLPPVQKLEHSGNVVFGTNVPEDED